VVESRAQYLRIYQEEPPRPPRHVAEGIRSLPAVLKAFERATGWPLRYVEAPQPDNASLTWSAPVNPGVGATPGHLRLEAVAKPSGDSISRVSPETAQQLASALASVLAELTASQRALWHREAELATAVPVVQHPREDESLAARLEAVLRGGAEAIGCRAAALYLLDDATTQLKLRSSYALAKGRLADPPRPLAGALADLEAMLGHAVVLNDPALMAHWSPPEDFPAAVCVPVATSTTILGTLWVFADERRDFTERETGLIEIVAGRLASDLEREILLREGHNSAQLRRQVADAERLQKNQLPTISPLLDGWDLAGWTEQAHAVGGDFYDWFTLPDGSVAVAVGDVMHQGVAAALAAGGVKSSLRSHGQYHRDLGSLLTQVNLTLWTGSAGDQFGSLFCGLLETATGRIGYATAGQPAVVVVGPDSRKSLSRTTPSLGESPEVVYRQEHLRLNPGEALLVFTDGFRDAPNEQGKALGEAGLAEPIQAHLDLSAKELVLLARDRLAAAAPSPSDDRTILVVKRTAP